MTSRFPKHLWIVLLLAFGAFLMSALISQYVFQRLPHLEDEVAYLYQAKMYAGFHLVIPTPQPQRSYWMPFLVDQGGLRFGKYTPGWSMQLAIGVLLGQTWIINAFFSALTIPLVYRLGKEIFNPDVGVVAAALTMFSPMALLLDGTLMGHTSALFAAMLFLYAYWRIEQGKRRIAWGIIAGLSLGALVANRPITGVAVAAPLILWSAIRLFRALAYDIHRLRNRGKTPPALPTVAPLPNMIVGAGFQASPIGAAAMVYPLPEITQPNAPTSTTFAPIRNVPVRGFFATLVPLIFLSAFTLLIASTVPIYNEAAVGNPTKDLYTLVWSYDTIGFGPCCGRAPHDIGKGINQARFDLSLTASDLFGWELGSLNGPDGKMNPVLEDHLLNQGDYWEMFGLSWILLPFALIIAYRKKAIFIALWTAVAYGLVVFAYKWQNGAQITDPTFSYAWLGTALIWLYLPLIFWRDRQRAWTWLLWSAAIGLVVMQMAYWIGSQRYSTRYFFEGLGAIAIISALPIAWLARRLKTVGAYLAWWSRSISEDSRALSTSALVALICSVALGVVFWVAPWVNTPIASITGNKLLYDLTASPDASASLWLIPIAAGVGIVGALWAILDLTDRRMPKIVTGAAGLIALAYYALVFSAVLKAQSGFSQFGIGFWIGAAISLLLLVQVAISNPVNLRFPLESVSGGSSRRVIYALFALALAYGFFTYSIPRIAVLTGYNFINSDVLTDLQAHRNGSTQPVLVIVNGSSAAWRSYGALMAQTSPYLNSDIVVAWNYEGDQGDVYKQIVARFPGRQIIEMKASGNYAWFADEQPPPQVASG
ncbi:MAG TPA: glycosyltransferase family 39 protein [Phototrophicaceae bacterium]|nr:glycosyltransferase family 39 protein [Phototrophicaceae bacterium]